MAHAREAQTKFDNYAPILIFGVLGYLIKDVVWTPGVSGYLNALGLFLLFTAGLCSLWRLERLPKFYLNAAEVNSATETRDRLVRLVRQRGADEELKNWLAATGQQLGHFSGIESAENRWAKRTYSVQRWAFVLGLLLLLVARLLPVFYEGAPK